MLEQELMQIVLLELVWSECIVRCWFWLGRIGCGLVALRRRVALMGLVVVWLRSIGMMHCWVWYGFVKS